MLPILTEGRSRSWPYVDLHQLPGRVERVDQDHVKYFLDLQPGKKQIVDYSVTYKRRKVGPELNTEWKREPNVRITQFLFLSPGHSARAFSSSHVATAFAHGLPAARISRRSAAWLT
jgi:hypothetical protein